MTVLSLRLALAATALASAGAAGWWLGAGRVQGRWDAAELQRERAVATLAAQERRRQHQAAADYAARERAQRAAATQALAEVRHELQRPFSCPPAASAAAASPLRLGDLPIPAAVVDRLRHAGADPRPD